jgi:hypothetical protein
MTYLSGPCKKQAELTFAMARHAVVDLSIIFDAPPCEPDEDRLPPVDLDQLKAFLSDCGFLPSSGADEDQNLKDLRYMYEPYLYSLAEYLCLAMPPWIPGKGQVDNWRTNPWGTIASSPEKIHRDQHGHHHF